MESIPEKLFPITEYISQKLIENHDLAFKYEDINIGVIELDLIIKEINFCLILDLSQACITLTNHLLEKTLKLLLIYEETGKKQVTDLSKIDELYGNACNRFNGKDLNDTINIACSKGLITKDEKKTMHEYRDRLRNGFSHSDMNKVFKKSKIPLIMGNFENPQKLEKGEATISQVPFLQGIAQEKVAKSSALTYYIFIHNIIKKNIHVLI